MGHLEEGEELNKDGCLGELLSGEMDHTLPFLPLFEAISPWRAMEDNCPIDTPFSQRVYLP